MATILKASRAVQPAATPFHLQNLRVVPSAAEEVERYASELLSQAEQQAIAICRAAEEQGRDAALEAAELACRQRLEQQLETLWPALQQAVAAMETARCQWLAQWERSAVQLATAIAARVVRREIAQTPEITVELVREALELSAGSPQVELRMHPDDVAALGGAVQRLIGELGRLGQVRVTADAAIASGGCRVDTRFGSIDQQLETRLARIEAELTR